MIPQQNVTANGAGKENKTVQRGLPVKPPPFVSQKPSLEIQIARLRRLFLVAGVAVAGVFLIAAAAFFFFRDVAPGTDMVKVPEEVKSAGKDAKPAEKIGALKPIPGFIERPPSKKLPFLPAIEGKGRESYLETIGGLSAVHLYQTYLNIGLLADAVENETYTYTEAVNVMLTVTELLTLVEKQLKKISPAGLTPDDAAALESVRHLSGLLRTQSSALVSYWASREEAHATRYQAVREESWTALKEMMGLED